MLYVRMTDTFLSNWGRAAGRISRFIVECETPEEAAIVADNAKWRTDQTDIKILDRKPLPEPVFYHTVYQTKADIPKWFIEGFFYDGEEVSG